MALIILNSFSKFHNKGKEPVCQNGTADFGRNILTEISGLPLEVIPNIPVRRNRNGVRNLWHNGKHHPILHNFTPTSPAQNFRMKFQKISVPFAPPPGIFGIFGRLGSAHRMWCSVKEVLARIIDFGNFTSPFTP